MASEMFGKYEVRGRLGAGAMGTVYDVFDPVIERRAALKTVRRPEPGDPEGQEAMARFRREAQAAGRLNHPHIVAVYDYGEDAATAWIAMELVEGGTLKDRLDRAERFPPAQVSRLMHQVLAALDYSHRRGVVHRDIKPANIMLTADEPGGENVKIADFGIARIENSAMTQLGTIMGTPAYMAPEQLRGEAVDSRADIWAAGVVLYQLLTGEKPFSGGYSSVQHKAINTEPTPPSVLSVTAPPAFDAVIARAMAKRPDDRFATAGAFAEALRAAGAAPVAAPAEDATVVATAPRPTQVTPPPGPAQAPASLPAAPSRPVAPAAPGTRTGPPIALIAGGGVLAAAGVAAFLLLGGTPREPATPERPSQASVGPPAAAGPGPTLTPGAGSRPANDPGAGRPLAGSGVAGANPGANTGTNPGANPGASPGTNPGINPGTNLGTSPDTNQGRNSGRPSRYRHNHATCPPPPGGHCPGRRPARHRPPAARRQHRRAAHRPDWPSERRRLQAAAGATPHADRRPGAAAHRFPRRRRGRRRGAGLRAARHQRLRRRPGYRRRAAPG